METRIWIFICNSFCSRAEGVLNRYHCSTEKIITRYSFNYLVRLQYYWLIVSIYADHPPARQGQMVSRIYRIVHLVTMHTVTGPCNLLDGS